MTHIPSSAGPAVVSPSVPAADVETDVEVGARRACLSDMTERCTPDERQLLDDIADNPPPDIAIDAFCAYVDARDAVVNAAKAETKAEAAALGGVLAAMTVRSGHPRHHTAQEATSDLTACREQRRAAVAALNDLERKGPSDD